MNALVMYDHQSETLWSQFLSRGVKGPLANTQLEILASLQTTWSQWLSLHPDTTVLDKRGRYQTDSYEGYYGGGSTGIIGESNKDERLPGKDLVLGVDLVSAAKAYPFRAMAGQAAINDFFSGRPVLIAFDPLNETVALRHCHEDYRRCFSASGPGNRQHLAGAYGTSYRRAVGRNRLGAIAFLLLVLVRLVRLSSRHRVVRLATRSGRVWLGVRAAFDVRG